MKKILLVTIISLSVSFISAQSSCCKGKAKGVSCQNSAQLESIDSKDSSKNLNSTASCCKNKSSKGPSCSKNKELDSTSSCSPKKWWQVWKKDCIKSCCLKA